MNRLLLSLWLLGAAVYGANTLIYANVIFGWPTTKHKVEVSDAGKQSVQPGAAAETQNQPSANPSDSRDAAKTAGHNVSVPVPPMPLAPQDQPASSLTGEQSVTLQPQPEQAQTVPVAEPQQQDESEWARVSRTGANVRSGPSSSASQLGTLPSGMTLRVVSREAGWVQIANADGSQTGWIYERVLEPTVAPSEQAEGSAELAEAGQKQQDQSEWVRVSGSSATMRSGPSDSAAMMFGFPEGRALRVMSRQPGWVQVIDPGSKQSGWIAETSLAAAGQQQQTADTAPQRRSRDAGPPAYDSAEGPPPGARGAWVPIEEDGMEEPGDRQRGRGHRRGGGMAGILRRAFGGY